MRNIVSDPNGRVDLGLAAAIWILAALVYVAAAQLPPPIFDPVGSAAIPKAIAIVLSLLAAGIVLQTWLRLRTTTPENPAAADDEGSTGGVAAALRPDTVAAAIAVIVGYTAVMAFGLLGFREATVPFVILLAGVLSHFRRSTILVAVPAAFALAIGFGWLFSEILYIDLPQTPWLKP